MLFHVSLSTNIKDLLIIIIIIIIIINNNIIRYLNIRNLAVVHKQFHKLFHPLTDNFIF